MTRQPGQTIEQLKTDLLEQNCATSLLERFSITGEIVNMVVQICLRQPSATAGSPLRVDSGAVRSIA
ncbi:hypothetical protein D9599_24615 [Roseomonas sp. KE2513]|nr:hypothetical protein [Roseomonas sp. KE2513]